MACLLEMPKLVDESLVIYNWIWHDLHKIYLIAKGRLTILLMLLHFTCDETSERSNEMRARYRCNTHSDRRNNWLFPKTKTQSFAGARAHSYSRNRQMDEKQNETEIIIVHVTLYYGIIKSELKKELLVLKADRVWVFVFFFSLV